MFSSLLWNILVLFKYLQMSNVYMFVFPWGQMCVLSEKCHDWDMVNKVFLAIYQMQDNGSISLPSSYSDFPLSQFDQDDQESWKRHGEEDWWNLGECGNCSIRLSAMTLLYSDSSTLRQFTHGRVKDLSNLESKHHSLGLWWNHWSGQIHVQYCRCLSWIQGQQKSDESTYAAYLLFLLIAVAHHELDKTNPTEDVRPCHRACTLTVSLGGHGASRSLCCPVGQEERKKDMDVILKMQE